MSYMLEFPSHPLPPNIRSVPYVLFGINDTDHFLELPSNIPLALVLYFAPKLRQWILPTPELTGISAIGLSLRTPYIGINIIADIDIEGLAWIVARMLQLAGLPMDKKVFLIQPPLLTCISIHKAWVALELPERGIQGLHTHMLSTLMLGDPVTPIEIKGIWHNFPTSSPIVHQMGLNFVRSHIEYSYNHKEFASVRLWYLETRERCRFFKSLEAQFPEFSEVQEKAVKTVNENPTASSSKTETTAAAPQKESQILEKRRTRKVSAEERKDRHSKDWSAMQRRLERTRSNDIMRSVDLSRTSSDESTDEQKPDPTNCDAHPQSVNCSALYAMVEELNVAEHAEQALNQALKTRDADLFQQ